MTEEWLEGLNGELEWTEYALLRYEQSREMSVDCDGSEGEEIGHEGGGNGEER